MTSPAGQPVLVVAAVIRDSLGRLLLTQRPSGRHMAGLWELPGGKVRPGEAPGSALARELAEELGVLAEVVEPMTFAVHEEPDLRIVLLFYLARIVRGEPRGLEGQAVAWVPPAELGSYETPPADAALVRRLMEEGRGTETSGRPGRNSIDRTGATGHTGQS